MLSFVVLSVSPLESNPIFDLSSADSALCCVCSPVLLWRVTFHSNSFYTNSHSSWASISRSFRRAMGPTTHRRDRSTHTQQQNTTSDKARSEAAFIPIIHTHSITSHIAEAKLSAFDLPSSHLSVCATPLVCVGCHCSLCRYPHEWF